MAKQRNRRHKPAPRGRRAPDRPGEPASSNDTSRDPDRSLASTPQPARELPAVARQPARLDPPPRPVFWFGYEVSWATVVLGRFMLFGVLAVDAVLAVSHAIRYGAGGFNVAQLPLLDAIGPTRFGYEAGQLICAYAFVLVAFGVATRVMLPIAAVLYAWMYFGSQVDGYQHHYLVSLLVLVACFVPWQRPDGAQPTTPVRSWALRLLLVQLGIVYLWAAISKLDPAWLDGSTLARQLHGPVRELIDATVGIKAASVMAVIGELALAATVWVRRAWWLALPIGLGFHLMILVGGFEIGLFTYVMFALYLGFVVPGAAWVWLAELPPLRWTSRAIDRLTSASTVVVATFTIMAIGAGLALAITSPLENGPWIGAIATIVPIGFATVWLRSIADRRPRQHMTIAAIAHVIALVTWTVVARVGDVPSDYYRRWGRTANRFETREVAEHAYRRLTELVPNDPVGHFYLGTLLLQRGQTEPALVHLHRAQQLEPTRARAWVAEARWLATNGNTAAAIEKAREATWAEPSNTSAQTLLERLTKTGAAPAGTDPNDD
ncbi:MAG: HTTM domain-containing protein [Kofleriaceae bacterium]